MIWRKYKNSVFFAIRLLFPFICGWLNLSVVSPYLPIVYFLGFAIEVNAYFEYFSVISGKGVCISFFFYLVQSFLG